MPKKKKEKNQKSTTLKIQPRFWVDGLLALVFVVLLNVFVASFVYKVDFTEDKRYSLSGESEVILERLSSELKITYFTSEEYPQNMIPVVNAVQDMLIEIEDANDENITVEIVFPNNDESAKNLAEEFQVPPLTYNVIEDTGASTSEGYSGLAFVYRDRQIAIPVVTDVSSLEYDIMSLVRKISSNDRTTVGIMSKHLVQPIGQFATSIDRQYSTISVDLSNIPDVDVLVVPGVSEDYSDVELYNLDQYILRRGKAIFLIDGSIVGSDFERGTLETNVHEALESYGISIGKDFIGDFASNERTNRTVSGSQVVEDYPLWIKIVEGLGGQHPIGLGIRSVLIPWATELTINSERQVDFSISTTDAAYAFSAEELPNTSPENLFAPSTQLQEKKQIGAFTSGPVRSFYVEKPDAQNEDFIEKSDDASLFVITSSSMIADPFLKTSSLNANLVLNGLDYMIGGENLASVRQKSRIDRPLDGEANRDIFRYGSVAAAASSVLVLMGVVGLYRRRISQKSKKRYV